MLEPIIRKFDRLRPELQKEVVDFMDFLTEKQKEKRKKKLGLSWIGGLKEYKRKFSALELQKKALEWRD